MEKSLCIGCEFEKDDKNNTICRDCEKRIQYIQGIAAGFEEICSMPKKTIKKESNMNKMRICFKCGEEKELIPENWQKNEKSKDGFRSPCNICRRKQQKEASVKRKNKTCLPNAKKEKTKSIIKETKEPVPITIELDFTAYPEHLEKIKIVARQEFRRPADQIMYWICNNTKTYPDKTA